MVSNIRVSIYDNSFIRLRSFPDDGTKYYKELFCMSNQEARNKFVDFIKSTGSNYFVIVDKATHRILSNECKTNEFSEWVPLTDEYLQELLSMCVDRESSQPLSLDDERERAKVRVRLGYFKSKNDDKDIKLRNFLKYIDSINDIDTIRSTNWDTVIKVLA